MALFKKSGASTVVSDSFGGLDCTQGPRTLPGLGYTRNFSVTSDGRLKNAAGYKKLLSRYRADTYFRGGSTARIISFIKRTICFTR